MVTLMRRCILVGLFFVVLGSTSFAAGSLEELLKKAQIEYTRGDDGTLKIVVSYEGETTLIAAKERSFGDNQDSELKLVYLYCVVLPGRKDGQLPAAELKKMAELNDKMPVGKVSLSEDDGTIFYNSSFWLATADEKTLATELYIAHMMRQELKKILVGF
ncbi:MAG: YbjN domain-containing protein [Bacteroidota bacterium]